MYNIYTRQDIIDLNNNGRVLLIANNKVYDAQHYTLYNSHPGGSQAFQIAVDKYENNEQDATTDFNFHSAAAKHQWDRHCIGSLSCECLCIII